MRGILICGVSVLFYEREIMAVKKAIAIVSRGLYIYIYIYIYVEAVRVTCVKLGLYRIICIIISDQLEWIRGPHAL